MPTSVWAPHTFYHHHHHHHRRHHHHQQPPPPPSLSCHLGQHSTFPFIHIRERKVCTLSDLLLGFLQFLDVFEYLAEPSDAGSLYKSPSFQTHVPFAVSSAFYSAKVLLLSLLDLVIYLGFQLHHLKSFIAKSITLYFVLITFQKLWMFLAFYFSFSLSLQKNPCFGIDSQF